MKTLSLHLLDVLENAVSAQANEIEIRVKDSLKENIYLFEVKDNGCGVKQEDIEKLTDAFFTSRTQRRVGLGLALVKMKTEQCVGGMNITSDYGKGTKLTYWFSHDNIDRPPLGDIETTIVMACTMKENIDLKYVHITDKGEYVFDTKEIKKVLEGMPVNNIKIQQALKELIKNKLLEISVNE